MPPRVVLYRTRKLEYRLMPIRDSCKGISHNQTGEVEVLEADIEGRSIAFIVPVFRVQSL